MSPSTHLYRHTRKLGERIGDSSSAGFVREVRDSDEKLFSREQNIATFKLRLWIRYLNQSQVQLFFQNRSNIFNLK